MTTDSVESSSNSGSNSSSSSYAEHLISFGDKFQVTAHEDIYNTKGTLVLRKGATINQSISERVVKFKLLQPIENSVNIEPALTPEVLLNNFNKIVATSPELSKFHQTENLDQQLSGLLKTFFDYPILVQKLTVMSSQMPDLFQQTIAVTWFSTVIAGELNLVPERIEHVFIAGLIHDVGMMHIDKQILNKKEVLTNAEWRQIQAHTIIGQKILENTANLCPNIARIVAEHHERCDGSGYPAGKLGEKLSLESQIIALCDSIVSVYFNKSRDGVKSLRDLIPLLQMNTESHFFSTHAAIMRLFRKMDLHPTSSLKTNQLDTFVSQLMEANNNTSKRYELIQELVLNLNKSFSDKIVDRAEAVLHQINRTVQVSGIFHPGYIRWIEQVRTEKLEFAFRELEDFSLMLDEVDWHLTRITRLLETYLESQTQSLPELSNFISTGLDNISAELKPEDFEL